MAVELSVATFGDGSLLAARLPAVVERVRTELIEPLVGEMRRQATAPAGDRAGGEPGACEVGFAVENAESLRASVYKYSDASWTRILRGLRENRWRSVRLDAWILGPEGTPRDAPSSFTFLIDLRGFEWAGGAHLVVFQISEDLARSVFGDRQAVLIDLVKDAVLQLEAATAYIARGATAFRNTRHEKTIRVTSGMGVDFSSEWLRGFEWGNVLSGSHIQKLGGVERVEREAPCAVVEELPSGGGTFLYLQLTHDLWDMAEDQVENLRRFLEPALLTSEIARGGPTISPRSVGDAAVPSHKSDPKRPAESGDAVTDKGVASARAPDAGEILYLDGEVDTTSVEFALELGGDVPPGAVEAFDDLLGAWYELGVHGVFGGFFHNMSGIDVERSGDGTKILWSMDMGSSGRQALDTLVSTLLEFAKVRGVNVRRLRLS